MSRPLLQVHVSPPEVVGEAAWRFDTSVAASPVASPTVAAAAAFTHAAGGAGQMMMSTRWSSNRAPLSSPQTPATAVPSPKLDAGTRVQSLLLSHVLAQPVAAGAKRAQRTRPPGQTLQVAM